tara:strand:+ start:750 stop:1067 length:318 start_codon:yes stop_codon:yes gene_type:complete
MKIGEAIALDIAAAFTLAFQRAGLEGKRLAPMLQLFKKQYGQELFEAFALACPAHQRARNNYKADFSQADKSARWLAVHYAGNFIAKIEDLRRRVGESYDDLWKD